MADINTPGQARSAGKKGSSGGGNIDKFKSSVTSVLKTARFEVSIFSPVGSAGPGSPMSLACHTVEGMGAQTFGTMDIRKGDALLRRQPNDVIFPDLSLSFLNVLSGGSPVVYPFFMAWMDVVNDNAGFGFADTYTGSLDITQLGDDGSPAHTYHIDNFYPISVSAAGLNGGSSNELHTVEVRGVQWPNR